MSFILIVVAGRPAVVSVFRRAKKSYLEQYPFPRHSSEPDPSLTRGNVNVITSAVFYEESAVERATNHRGYCFIVIQIMEYTVLEVYRHIPCLP